MLVTWLEIKCKKQYSRLATSFATIKKLAVLWDSGANVSLITQKAATSLNLDGSEVELSITKIGNQSQEFRTKRYAVPLIDANGKYWETHAYGIEEITSDLREMDLSPAAKMFHGITP